MFTQTIAFIDGNQLKKLPENRLLFLLGPIQSIRSISSSYLCKVFQENSTGKFDNCYLLNTNISLEVEKHLSKMKKIKATYRIRLVEKEGIDSYEKEGKWEGVFIVFESSETVINEIK